MFGGMAALVRFGRSPAAAPTAKTISERQMNFRPPGFINNHSPREMVGQTTWERRPSLPACIGQSVIAGNPAGKDGRRSQVVCPTLTPRFSFFQRTATGLKAPAENRQDLQDLQD